MALSTYTPLCHAIVELFTPLVEVVIHDINTNTIAYINGTLSKRSIGDPSLLETEELASKTLDRVVYTKLALDGRQVQSVSTMLEDRWLLCINLDISLFSKMKELSEIFLNISKGEKPKALFASDWQEDLNTVVGTYMQKRSLSLSTMHAKDRKSLVKHLWEHGAFQHKHAAEYIAKALNMGRATIFNYLKEWRTL